MRAGKACIILFTALFIICQTNLQLRAGDLSGVMRVDVPVFDFGTVKDSQGPLSCEFVLENISDGPVCILDITSSCGCTRAKWPKSPVKPGKSAVIKATFDNDEGPVPFDKALTVRLTGTDELIFLHMTGNVIKDLDNPGSEFSSRIGLVRLKDRILDMGHLKELDVREGRFTIYNPYRDSVWVEILSGGRNLILNDNVTVVPGRGTVELNCTLSAPEGEYGHFTDTLLFRTRRARTGRWKQGLALVSYTVESSPSHHGHPPYAEISLEHMSLGRVSGWKSSEFTFSITNSGMTPLSVFRMESDSGSREASSSFTVPSGQSREIKAAMDFRSCSPGTHLTIIDIYTDSARNPVLHLYVTYRVRPSFRSLFRRNGGKARCLFVS